MIGKVKHFISEAPKRAAARATVTHLPVIPSGALPEPTAKRHQKAAVVAPGPSPGSERHPIPDSAAAVFADSESAAVTWHGVCPVRFVGTLGLSGIVDPMTA
jgi:hypothetical protein